MPIDLKGIVSTGEGVFTIDFSKVEFLLRIVKSSIIWANMSKQHSQSVNPKQLPLSFIARHCVVCNGFFYYLTFKEKYYQQ